MAKRTGLGRGIGALIPTAESAEARPVDVFFPGAAQSAGQDAAASAADETSSPVSSTDESTEQLLAIPGTRLIQVDPNEIVPNPRQPRTNFDPDDLAELVHSVREFGVLQPVVVRTNEDGKYELKGEGLSLTPAPWGSAGGSFDGEAPDFEASLTAEVSLREHLGAQLDLGPGASVTLDVDPTFEHALLLDSGAVTLDERRLEVGELGVLDPGPSHLRLDAGAEGARVILLGGAPFEDEVVMWWNFMGPDHEAIDRARREWEAGSDRFGVVPGDDRRLPAPPLPPVRLRGRRRLPLTEPPAVS